MKSNFYILSGGPGSGKTTVLQELSKAGYRCISEVGRQVIKEQVCLESDALPWKNKESFRDLMLKRAIDDYQSISKTDDPVFFDRGLLDILGYSKLEKIPTNQSMIDLICSFSFNNEIFMFPPWAEIYCQDSERTQSFDLAKKTYHAMVEVYTQQNYLIQPISQCSPSQRAKYIISRVEAPKPGL